MSWLRSTLLAIVSATVSFVPTSSLAAQMIGPDQHLATQLRQSDEILLRAVHTANRAAWQTFAAPDFFYLDEEGGVTYLDAFLRQLVPMTSKPLQIQAYTLTRQVTRLSFSTRIRTRTRSDTNLQRRGSVSTALGSSAYSTSQMCFPTRHLSSSHSPKLTSLRAPIIQVQSPTRSGETVSKFSQTVRMAQKLN